MNKKQKAIVIAFGLLAALCMTMIGASSILPPYSGRLMADAGFEGFKITIAALIGALSAIIGSSKKE